MQLSPEQELSLLNLSRGVIRAALAGDASPPIPSDPELGQPAGCFVSLHQTRGHNLRGCVGRLDAKAPLAETVAAMSRGVLEDPRFDTDPVRLDELPLLDIELSILSPLQLREDPLDFDLLNDGIYLTYHGRSGCFLPQVARETGWSKPQLLERLCTEKLGVGAWAWKEPGARLFIFKTLVVGPVGFVGGKWDELGQR